MAIQKTFRAKITSTTIHPTQLANEVRTATMYGLRKIAYNIRDEMRQSFRDSIHQSAYGSMLGGSASDLENYIVASQLDVATQSFTVGAKQRQIYGNQYVSEIFQYMDEGTDTSKHWTFKLQGKRQGLTDNGFMTVYGQEPKEFITGTAKRYGVTGLQKDTVAHVATSVEASMMMHGKQVKSFLKK